MSKRITLVDVARLAQVSRATASLVLRESPAVAQVTRERVLRAMQELGYVYNRSAAGLRSARSGVVGIVLPNVSNPFFASFLEGTERILGEARLTSFLVIVGEDAVRGQIALQRLNEHGCDGLVICAPDGSGADAVGLLRKMNVPTVQALRSLSSDYDYIGPDYAQGIGLAVAHLVASGRRKIAFLTTGAEHSAARERLQGLRAAQLRHGLEPISVVTVGDDLAPDLAKQLHAEGVTGVIAFNDMIALEFCGALSDLGVVVGRDMAVIGFDGLAIGRLMRPQLTSIDTAPARLGQAVAQQLIARLCEPGLPVVSVRRETELRSGGTTGAVVTDCGDTA